MEERIQNSLNAIEENHQVRILFAIESGSRAWGFASPDSDYDVRFVYAREAKDYLSVSPPRDVIELPIVDDLDVNGWDMYKALKLFRSSNPPLLEWLHSPIVYRVNGDFMSALRELADTHYSPRRMTYHYLSMAKGNFKDYIADKTEVTLKKYLYVLRPLLCILWLEQKGTPPPTFLPDTLAAVQCDTALRDRVTRLIEQKRGEGELGVGEADSILNTFITAEIERVSALVAEMPDVPMDTALLDSLAWKVLL